MYTIWRRYGESREEYVCDVLAQVLVMIHCTAVVICELWSFVLECFVMVQL